MIAMCAALLMCVAAVAATPTVAAGRVATQLIDVQSSKTGDLYLGDQIITTGRLVDANGNGIPNQQVNFKGTVSVPIMGSMDVSSGSATTDSSGAFSHESTVSANGMSLPLVSTVTVTGWVEYAGNDVYLPSNSPHVTQTVHLS